jgi:glutamate synthase domain-containing protein 3
MSKKEDKKPLLRRLVDREEVDLKEYSMKEIEQVIKELVELHIDRVRSEEALRLLDAIAIAVDKVRTVLRKEEK